MTRRIETVFGWLFRRKRTGLEPESGWIIAIDETSISVTDPSGQTKSVSKDDLSGVLIETNDSGPGGADLWWLLFGGDDQVACMFPQGAIGESGAIDYLMSLPAFDHQEMIGAMRSTDNAIFPVWRRKA
jgi:hypothetical protein